ncbi:TOM complex component Tom7 [Apiospora arundinis]
MFFRVLPKLWEKIPLRYAIAGATPRLEILGNCYTQLLTVDYREHTRRKEIQTRRTLSTIRTSVNSSTAKMFALSEESKERIGRIIELSRVAMHYGYIPLILYLGYSRSDPRPSIIRLLSPLS